MALPTLVDSGETFEGGSQSNYGGPFSANGNVYVIATDDFADNVKAYRATDPTSSFTEVDQVVTTPTIAMHVLWATQHDNIIHIVTAHAETDGDYYYHTFNMDTELFVVENEVMDSPQTIDPLSLCAMVVVRSDGDVCVCYGGDQDKVMGVDYDRVDFATRQGSTWTAGTDLTNHAAGGIWDDLDYYGAAIALGDRDDLHFGLSDWAGDPDINLYIRTMQQASLSSWPTAADTTVGGEIRILGGKTTSFVDGANHRVRIPYRDGDDKTSVVEFNSSGAAPTLTINTDVAEFTVRHGATADKILTHLVRDQLTEYMLYVRASNGDLYLDTDGGATDTLLRNSGSNDVDILSGNIIERDGPKLAFLFSETTDRDLYYDEVDLKDTALATLADGEWDHQGIGAMGPYIGRSGASVYQPVLTATGTRLTMMKSTGDPTTQSNWAQVGGNEIFLYRHSMHQSGANAIAAFQDQDEIHIVTTAPGGATTYHLFDTSDDTWTVRQEMAGIPFVYKTVGSSGASDLRTPTVTDVAVRSDGDVIVVFGRYTGVSAFPNAREVHYSRREGGTWTRNITAHTNIDGMVTGGIILALSDRIHMGATRLEELAPNNEVRIRTLTSANVLQTIDTIDVNGDMGHEQVVPRGVWYSNRIYLPYADDTNDRMFVSQFASADVTTGGTGTAVQTAGAVLSSLEDTIAAMAVDSIRKAVYLFWVDTSNDLWWSENVDEGGWSTPAEVLAGVGPTRVSVTVFSRNGKRVIGIIHKATTIKYAELDVSLGTVANLSDGAVVTTVPNYVGPFKT